MSAKENSRYKVLAELSEPKDSTRTDEGDPPAQRQPAFALTLFRFQEAIDAVRQLHDEVCGHAAELDRQRVSPEQLSAVKSLDPERQEKFKKWLEDVFAPSEESAEADGDKGADEESAEGDEGLTETDMQMMTEVFGENPVAIGQAQMLLQRNILMAPSREGLLRSSLLTMAVAAFEALLGGLAARHYEMHPASIGGEKKFTLKEIAGYESIEDIQDAAIEHRVYYLLQGSLDDWAKWLDQISGLHVKLENLAISYEDLEEIIQRRHVIVHNGGVASARYLEKVKPDESVTAGSRLEVTADYLEMALDNLDSLGNLVGVTIWAKNRPDAKHDAASVLSNRMEQLLFAHRWRPLRQLSSYGKKVAPLDVHKQIFKVNEWLAIKRLDGLDGITEEIRDDWDTSAMGQQFQLVQMALLDETDAFFRFAPIVVREGAIQEEQLTSWPIFEEVRRDPRFSDLLAGKEDLDSTS